MTIIKERRHGTITRRRVEFKYKNDPNWGFSFRCDSEGRPLFENPDGTIKEIQRANYENCLVSDDFEGPYLIEEEISMTEPAEGICRCGERVLVQNRYMGAFSCPKCGQWYNLFGQELLPPHLWND